MLIVVVTSPGNDVESTKIVVRIRTVWEPLHAQDHIVQVSAFQGCVLPYRILRILVRRIHGQLKEVFKICMMNAITMHGMIHMKLMWIVEVRFVLV